MSRVSKEGELVVPEWTLRKGQDLGLREVVRDIREILANGLDLKGRCIRRNILVGVGSSNFVVGIVRGNLDPNSSHHKEPRCDRSADISIEPLEPISTPGFYKDQLYRGRIILPGDFNKRPIWKTVVDGHQVVIEDELRDIETELNTLMEAAKIYTFWKPTKQGGQGFIRFYNNIAYRIPHLFESDEDSNPFSLPPLNA